MFAAVFFLALSTLQYSVTAASKAGGLQVPISVLTSLSIRGGVGAASPYEQWTGPSQYATTGQVRPQPIKTRQPQRTIDGPISLWGEEEIMLRDLEDDDAEVQQSEDCQATLANPYGSFDSVQATVGNQMQRVMKNLHQESATLSTISGCCLVVFLLWQIPAMNSLLQTHCVCDRSNIRAGRLGCLFLSVLSHASPVHLLINLYMMLNIGQRLHRVLQTRKWPLWPLIAGSALFGNLTYLIKEKTGGCLGLSSATLAMFSFQAKLFPDEEYMPLSTIFPFRIHNSSLLKVLLAWSLIGSGIRASSVAHIAHFAGLIFGLGFFEMWNVNKHHLLQSFRHSIQKRIRRSNHH